MSRALILAAMIGLGACSTPLPFPADGTASTLPTDPIERSLAAASMGAASGAAIGATLSLPFPIATIPATALGAATGAAFGAGLGLFTAP